MNKRKIGAAVLLLALGLGPIQTSQNYNLKLNNLAYAEEVGAEGVGSDDNQEGAGKGQTENPDQEKVQNQGDTELSDDSADSSLDISEEDVPTPVSKDNDTNEKTNEDAIKESLEAQDKAVRKSEAFKLATEAEIKEYEAKYSEIEKKVSDYLGEDKELDASIKELKGDFLTHSINLGYNVVKNLPKRMELRRLKAELETASKKAGKEYSEDLKEIIKKTDEILASKEHTPEEIEANLTSLTKAVEAYKKDNSVDIAPSKITAEEAKYGYPDDVYSGTRGKEKDLSELRLDARVMLEDLVDDEKAQARKAELKKKVDANTASEAEKKEHANLTNYDLVRLALADKMLDPEIEASDLLASINAYKEAAGKIVIEDEENSELDNEYNKLVKEYEEVKNSDNYKNSSDEKKKAYDKALEEFKNKDYKTKEDLDAAKTKMGEAKNALSVTVTTEEEKEIESELEKHSEFINSENFRRATASYQNAYKDAYKALTDERTKENLDKLIEAKKAIDDEDFVKEFNDKADQLERYIDKAKSDKITEESLKKLKEEYKEKLQALRDNKDADTDDIKALEDEFNENLNPEKAEPGSNKDPKKTTKKVVTSSKKSNGKVRTGVDAILPVVGGVAVVAAIALIFTRKKNK